MVMNCREVRRVLAVEIAGAPPDALGAARAHVAACAACRARLDQFGTAIVAGFDGEIPCAECRARLDRYVGAEIGGRAARRAFPLVDAHLVRCPECAEEYRRLVASLAGLRDESLPVPPAYPRFDVGFAAAAPRASQPSGAAVLAGAMRAWWSAGGAGRWVSRGAMGMLAVLVLGLIAGLLATQPALWLRVQTLAPNPDTRATAAAAIAATETTSTGQEPAGEDSIGTAGAGAGPRGRATLRAGADQQSSATVSATLDLAARQATAALLAATRQARDQHSQSSKTPRRWPAGTATLTPTAGISLTLTAPAAVATGGAAATAGPGPGEPTGAPPPPPPNPPGPGYPGPSKPEPKDPYP